MNIVSLKIGWIQKVVAAVMLVTLIASAFPASFFVANAADEAPAEAVVAPAVPGCMDPEATNYNSEANVDDESCEYPVLENIEVCKYTYGEGETTVPVAGWNMLVTNSLSESPSEGDVDYNVTTGSDGCVTVEVDRNNGPWYALEYPAEGWSFEDIDVDGGYILDSSEINTCVFFDWELSKVEVSRSAEYDYGCYFLNRDNREEVSGYKWNDENNNGVHDEGEDGVGGWKITATDVSGSEYTSITATTDSNGFYSMLLPDDGQWVISEESRSNWTQTAVYKNGYQMFEDTEEGAPMTDCTFDFSPIAVEVSALAVVVEAPSLNNRCDFLNHEEPRRSGGGGTRVKERATPQPLVLGAATGTPACGMYLNDYMRMGKEASSTEVTKLQVFLNAVGITLAVTGVFDTATDAAVRKFQAQHKAEVLTPWYIAKIVPHENPTGWVYQLTRWKINNIVCPGSEAYPVLN